MADRIFGPGKERHCAVLFTPFGPAVCDPGALGIGRRAAALTLIALLAAQILRGNRSHPPGIAGLAASPGQILAGNLKDPLVPVFIRPLHAGILIDLRYDHAVPIDIEMINDTCAVCPAIRISRIQSLVRWQIPVQLDCPGHGTCCQFRG